MRQIEAVKKILQKEFDKNYVGELLKKYENCIVKFEEGDWEGSLQEISKFIEIVVKMLWKKGGKFLPGPREFKAGNWAQKIINGEIQKTDMPHDGLRLQIPRLCLFIYDVVSNRGARHHSEEVNPNELDNTTVVPGCSWILAELVRFSSGGKLSMSETKSLIDVLIERKYPFFQEIDGRIYVEKKLYGSSLECAVLILYKNGSKRMSKLDLMENLKRHQFKRKAIDNALQRIKEFVDVNLSEEYLLRSSGKQKAEALMGKNN